MDGLCFALLLGSQRQARSGEQGADVDGGSGWPGLWLGILLALSLCAGTAIADLPRRAVTVVPDVPGA